MPNPLPSRLQGYTSILSCNPLDTKGFLTSPLAGGVDLSFAGIGEGGRMPHFSGFLPPPPPEIRNFRRPSRQVRGEETPIAIYLYIFCAPIYFAAPQGPLSRRVVSGKA